MLVLMANYLARAGVRPAAWGIFRIKYISKGEPTSDFKMMKPVSIGSVLGKFVERLFKPRLESLVGHTLNSRQAAFHKGRSTIDALINVAAVIHRCHGEK